MEQKTIEFANLHTRLDGRYLMVTHLKGRTEQKHWHVQLEIDEAQRSKIKRKLLEFSKNHPLRSNGKRPVKAMAKNANELGFQYMMKEGPDSVVSQRGFTVADIVELTTKCAEYVAALKSSLWDYLRGGKPLIVFPREMLMSAAMSTTYARSISWYVEQDTHPPPNLRSMVVYYVLKSHSGYIGEWSVSLF